MAKKKTSTRSTLTRSAKTTGAKKATARGTTKRASAKRDLVRRKTGSAYAKRASAGKFREMDDVGRSRKVDRRKKAKRAVKSGYGDQGDRSRSGAKKSGTRKR